MARVAPIVPSETDQLCEGCGYTLNGLPESGNCPECGKPIAESTIHAPRAHPAWERQSSRGGVCGGFWRTTAHVLFRPTDFYRTLRTRDVAGRSQYRFAAAHWWLASVLFAFAGALHFGWLVSGSPGELSLAQALLTPLLATITYLALDLVTRLAARLTAWEANYRGIRIPHAVALRGLHYHAAHYLPVALLAVATVGGYQLLLGGGVLSYASAEAYLWVLSGEVVVGAVYLFQTYWIGMRNVMYANR